MTAASTILLAVDLAGKKRELALKQLGKAQSAYRFANDQMAQLEHYAGETDGKYLRTGASGMSPALLFHHTQFMGRLLHAIDLQRQHLLDADQDLILAKKGVLDVEFRLVRLKHLLASQRAVARAQQARREQKETDEFAAHQHVRRGINQARGELL